MSYFDELRQKQRAALSSIEGLRQQIVDARSQLGMALVLGRNPTEARGRLTRLQSELVDAECCFMALRSLAQAGQPEPSRDQVQERATECSRRESEFNALLERFHAEVPALPLGPQRVERAAHLWLAALACTHNSMPEREAKRVISLHHVKLDEAKRRADDLRRAA